MNWKDYAFILGLLAFTAISIYGIYGTVNEAMSQTEMDAFCEMNICSLIPLIFIVAFVVLVILAYLYVSNRVDKDDKEVRKP